MIWLVFIYIVTNLFIFLMRLIGVN